VIVLDTHIWVWWVLDNDKLTARQQEAIRENEADEIGVSSISIWEVAKLVELKRLELPLSLEEWFSEALNYPGIQVIELSPEIAIESTRLPGQFHRDPADQIIVATARIFDCPLVTSDEKILNYAHVKAID
jgi:PIN domain nuclease of toxin-antitoxin system